MAISGLFTRTKTRWFYALMPYKGCEGIFALILPLYLFTILQLSVIWVGILTALISLGAVIGAIFWGYISDQWHTRRAFIVIGCLASGLCLLAISWTANLVGLSILCVAFGFFSIAPAPISSVLIMETLPKPQWDRSFGQFTRIGGWGWISGLLVAVGILPLLEKGFTPGLSMRLTLCGCAVLMVATAWWALHTIPQPKRRVRRREFITVTDRLPRLSMVERVLYLPRRLLFVVRPAQLKHLRITTLPRPLVGYLVATLVMFTSFIMALTPFPVYLQDVYGMDNSLIFTLVLIRALSSAPFYTLAGRWTQTLGVHRIHTGSLLLRCVAFIGLGGLHWLSDYNHVFGLLIAINIVVGLSWSGLAVSGPVWVGQLAEARREGEAMGLYNAAQGVAQIVGALLGGYLAHQIGYPRTFALAGILLLPTMACLLSVRRQHPATPIDRDDRPRQAA